MNTNIKYSDLLVPVLMLIALSIAAVLARPMTPIDETRYISVAWEMWLRDEYFVLFKNGEPYSHKPPLLFWLYNLGWMAFGVNEWWPRMVSPLFSIGGLFLTLSIANRLWPHVDGVGRNAVWILSSSLLWMVFSTSGMFDVMLAFFVLLGIRGILIARIESMRKGFVWLAVSIGMGVLAKGPVVLLHLLPVAVLAPWWTGNRNVLGAQTNWKHWYGAILLAVLGGAAIALTWAIPAAMRGGEEYKNAIFWGQTANRMVDSFAHKRPIWWYLPLLPLLLFPWLMWTGLWQRFFALGKDGLNSGLRFCLAWMLPVFTAFSFISGKQIHYLVPLFPAFALFSGYLLTQNLPRSNLWLPSIFLAIAGIAMVYVAWMGLPPKSGLVEPVPLWPGLLLMVAALASTWIARRWDKKVVLALLGVMLYGMVLVFISNNAWRSYDVHPMAQEISKYQQRGLPVANLGGYHAQYQFAGRLLEPVQLVSGLQELASWLQNNPAGLVVVYASHGHEPDTYLFKQPYRGEVAVLLNAEQAALFKGKSGGESMNKKDAAVNEGED